VVVPIQIGMVLEYDKTVTKRVLWIDDAGGFGVLIDVFSTKAKVYITECSLLDEDFDNGIAKEIDDPFLYLRSSEEQYSEARRNERDCNARAMFVLTNAAPEQRFDRNERGRLIEQITSRESGDPLYRSKGQVYALWRRYCQRGQMENAFLSDRQKAGRSAERRKLFPSTKKQGRNRLGASQEERRAGLLVTEDIEDTLVNIGKLFWEARQKNGNRRSWPEALQKGYERFFNKGFRTVKGVRTPDLQAELPTLAQLKHAYFSRRKFAESIKKRIGVKAFNLKCRPLNSDQRSLAWGPMHLVQIDVQVAKIYLVHPVTREVIDRPSVVFLRDTMSRVIAGFAVSWEHERWTVYMMGIENMARDKVEYCKTLGFDIDPGQWPCNHIPEGTLGDNGSMISKAAQGFRKAFDLTFFNTGGARPDMKPIIEGGFRDFDVKLTLKLPGAVPVESADPYADPAVKHAREQATLDIHEYRQLIVYYILDYNQRLLIGYPLTDQMKLAVNPIPLDLWNWGVTHRLGHLREVPIDLVRLHCLSRGRATVAREGIIFEGKSFLSARAVSEDWQVRAAISGSWKVDVLFHPDNLQRIYMRREHAGNSPKEPLLEELWRTRTEGERLDIALGELRFDRERTKLAYKRLGKNIPQKNAVFNAQIDSVVGPATKKTREALGGGKQHVGERRQRRQAAKDEERSSPMILVQPAYDQLHLVQPVPVKEDDALPSVARSDFDLLDAKLKSLGNENE
jgi:putative transposase